MISQNIFLAQEELIEGNLLLIGPPGSGKTTLGVEISKELGCAHYDTDALLQERFEGTPRELMQARGEKRFRELEVDVLKSLLTVQNSVISVGGGAPIFKSSFDLCQKIGVSFYLKIDKEILLKRLLSRQQLPLFLDVKDPRKSLEKLLSSREPTYMLLAKRTLVAETHR